MPNCFCGSTMEGGACYWLSTKGRHFPSGETHSPSRPAAPFVQPESGRCHSRDSATPWKDGLAVACGAKGFTVVERTGATATFQCSKGHVFRDLVAGTKAAARESGVTLKQYVSEQESATLEARSIAIRAGGAS